ncbi:aquaporin-like protein [Trematosphaeria pertusa]|uniref:Aquaporin-like protein n=1 Tax=Trematosphaeria pertusa TaxID=390896 RepID=A0A6A6J1L1_9PLEO|nr:aquaporin-like protein [Trematosphaeria pertusa]KAF2256546.1 aquaporin-like protein [Trematosphaeria pertusa]
MPRPPPPPPLPPTPPKPTNARAQRKPNRLRKELAVFLGEFIGTFMFLFLAFAGTQIALQSATINPFIFSEQAEPPEVLKLIYVAFAFGAALAITAAIFADVSGGMFNPAVTTALWLVRSIRWPRALHSILAQILASICASFTVALMLPGTLKVTTSPGTSVSLVQALLLETFLTTQLIITILMLPPGASKPMYIGTALFVAELAGVYSTGGSLNPARSVGPAVVAGFQTNHWIYWVGPMIGAGLGAGIFTLVKSVQGERV